MTPSVAVPFSGLAGWRFLEETVDRQIQTISRNAVINRSLDHFRETIASVETPEALVADYRLLEVALGAFGLTDDLGNRFFIRKVLAEGTIDPDSFANRLSDKRYFELAKAFSFDLQPPNTILKSFAEDIGSRYLKQKFEVGVGASDGDLRLALAFKRSFPDLTERSKSEDAVWFTVLGTDPLRRVLAGALAIPPAASGIGVDRQLELFREKAKVVFGTSDPKELASPEMVEEVVKTFLIRSTAFAATTSAVRGSVALSLLQSSVLPGS